MKQLDNDLITWEGFLIDHMPNSAINSAEYPSAVISCWGLEPGILHVYIICYVHVTKFKLGFHLRFTPCTFLILQSTIKKLNLEDPSWSPQNTHKIMQDQPTQRPGQKHPEHHLSNLENQSQKLSSKNLSSTPITHPSTPLSPSHCPQYPQEPLCSPKSIVFTRQPSRVLEIAQQVPVWFSWNLLQSACDKTISICNNFISSGTTRTWVRH
jgi:hypothetical protein